MPETPAADVVEAGGGLGAPWDPEIVMLLDGEDQTTLDDSVSVTGQMVVESATVTVVSWVE